jgi:hypothetical protein
MFNVCYLRIFAILSILVFAHNLAFSQAAKPDTTKQDTTWKTGGGLGLDFANLLLINPKIGAGENNIGIGGNTSFYAKYRKGRARWNNAAALNFAVQKLGRGGTRPFQKSQDEIRLTSIFSYDFTKDNPFAYAFDVLLLSQITPTYEGNFLAYKDTPIRHAISRFFSPATLTASPGVTYKPDAHFTVLLSPASLKMTIVTDDSIARLGNAGLTNSLHGNPFGRFESEEAFRQSFKTRPSGQINDSTYYGNVFMQMGATLKASYQNKFFKDKDGKPRLSFTSSLNLFSNYLRDPQNIDVEWITQTDLIIVKGLSLTLMTNLFYDHDILVQLDRDKDITTGVNGYESTGRRVSYTQAILLKYNFIF